MQTQSVPIASKMKGIAALAPIGVNSIFCIQAREPHFAFTQTTVVGNTPPHTHTRNGQKRYSTQKTVQNMLYRGYLIVVSHNMEKKWFWKF